LPICTYAEMQFIKAEAALKKGDFGTALNAYKNGIAGNMDMLTTYYTGYVPITATDKNNYINNPAVSPPVASDLTQRMIMQQKYIALYGWGFVETWVDMRKHNYDVVNIYPGWKVPTGANDLFPDNAGKLAYRIRPRYDSEYLWNREKLDAIGGTQPDYHTKKTWFSEP
ncbi:MAG: SusD/RagB family nutrient-binding outer membrane lipoprotein, partial [Dinghuibacter sp.]|nr:SusD/RagB family nutrient-binding outer membrane lipoprotein [Dinghuibacter sp.]